MGILGLTTFMKNNSQLTKEYMLHSTKVVIDGNSLYHFIFYMNDNQLDFYHGGDYDEFAIKVSNFFQLLQSCDIQPYVVFDVGSAPNDMKFETIRGRMKQRLENAMRLANGLRGKKKVMPILAFDTFRAVLKELNILFAVCDFEADKEIAILANMMNCPVLSNDSDFFILPLRSGFISFENVEFNSQEIGNEINGLVRFLPARLYHIDNFVQCFPSLEGEVLPLLAALLGNDYIAEDVFQSFHVSIQSYRCETQFWKSSDNKRTLKVVLWLQGLKSYSEGINKIMSKAKSKNKKTISLAIKATKKAFQTNASDTESYLYSCFTGKGDLSGHSIRGHNGSVIPRWYVCHHRKGCISPSCLDIVTLHRKFLIPQVEDPKSSSTTYQCSVNLRRFLYGILLSEDNAGFDMKDGLASNRKCAVGEFDRKGYIIHSKPIYPVELETYFGKLPSLSEIPDLLPSKRENLIRMILNIPSFGINHMTKDLVLILGIVYFWIKNAQRKVTISHLQSVLVCLIMLKVKWVLIHKGPTGCGENLIEAEVLDMDTKILEKVNSNFNQYKNRNNKVDCGLIHGFAQFQTCIMATMHLNSLLLDPFPGPCIPHIFSGTFLYNFCKELQENRNPDELIHELLSKDSNLPQIYKCFYDAVCNALCPAAFINKYFKDVRYHYDKENKQNGGKQRAQRDRKRSLNRNMPVFLKKTRTRLKGKDQVQNLLLSSDLS